mmetsp:Transcript_7994/g.19965  ORF Transcript_7994/g.19965 Transcript_7994/m.19965 type:complete len:450 (+) Transcript_7994:1036-2385(+)
MLLAELLDELRRARQRVPRERGPDVVLDLVAEPAGEPAVEGGRRDVACRTDLELGEIDLPGVLGREDVHGVVSDGEDEADEEAAEGLGDEGEECHVEEGGEAGDEEEEGEVVDGEGDDFGGLEGPAADVLVGGGGLELCGLDEPGDAGHAEDGEVEVLLVADEEGRDAGELLDVALEEVLRPEQDGVGVDVGVADDLAVADDVGDGVVVVVLELPPGRGEALPEVADDEPHDVAPHAVLEDLVVEEVVREPAALLEEEAEDGGGEDGHAEGCGVEGERHRGGEDRDVGADLVGVKRLGRLEPPLLHQGRPHLRDIGLQPRHHPVAVLLHDLRALVQLAHVEILEHRVRLPGVERGKHPRRVPPCVSVHDPTTRMRLREASDIEDAAADRDPRRHRGVVVRCEFRGGHDARSGGGEGFGDGGLREDGRRARAEGGLDVGRHGWESGRVGR